MRQVLLVALLMAAFGIVVVPSAADPATNCTREGTIHDDALPGTRGDDVICGRGGRDYIHGGQGNDIARGQASRDTLVGGAGFDVLVGGGKGDRIFAVDGQRDVIIAGAGNDRCFVDPADRVKGCERIFRGLEVRDVEVLADIMYDTMIESEDGDLGEPFLDEAYPPAPPVSGGAGFPPCTPPPPGGTSPAPCPGG